MNKFFWIGLIAIAGVIGWFLWDDELRISNSLSRYMENGEISTLEAKYSPEAIMEKNKKTLLPDSQYTFEEPCLKYSPYLLIQAKYTLADRKTREGSTLWSLIDGEMVLDTNSWESTHGFEDAINANATRTDFKILNALAKYPGGCTNEKIQEELHLDGETIAPWIKSACQKHLAVQLGNEIQLHVEKPKILVSPETKIHQALVTKSYGDAERLPTKYSRAQIERVAQAAFGPTYTIRKVTEVYLPIVCIQVLNPDDSVLTSYWNALNGQRIK